MLYRHIVRLGYRRQIKFFVGFKKQFGVNIKTFKGVVVDFNAHIFRCFVKQISV